MFSLLLEDVAATQSFARRLASFLGIGDVVYLKGDLGAGKTTFAQALIGSFGAPPCDVSSPTFSLVHVYDDLPLPIWHADLYRLTSPEEITELGLWQASSQALLLIEWPENMHPYRFPDPLSLTLSSTSKGRMLKVEGSAKWALRLQMFQQS